MAAITVRKINGTNKLWVRLNQDEHLQVMIDGTLTVDLTERQAKAIKTAPVLNKLSIGPNISGH